MKIRFLFMAILLLSGCTSLRNDKSVDKNSNLFSIFTPETQVFVINQDQESTITGKQKTTFIIPPDSFECGDKIRLELREYYDPLSMASRGVTMNWLDNNNELHHLKTYGMFQLDAFCGGKATQLKDGMRILVKSPYADQKGKKVIFSIFNYEDNSDGGYWLLDENWPGNDQRDLGNGNFAVTISTAESPDADPLYIIVTDNNIKKSELPMIKNSEGRWEATISFNIKFKYLFFDPDDTNNDGTKYVEDPETIEWLPNPFGSRDSVIRRPLAQNLFSIYKTSKLVNMDFPTAQYVVIKGTINGQPSKCLKTIFGLGISEPLQYTTGIESTDSFHLKALSHSTIIVTILDEVNKMIGVSQPITTGKPGTPEKPVIMNIGEIEMKTVPEALWKNKPALRKYIGL